MNITNRARKVTKNPKSKEEEFRRLASSILLLLLWDGTELAVVDGGPKVEAEEEAVVL